MAAVAITVEEDSRTEGEEGAAVDEAAIGDAVVEADSVGEDVMMMVRDADTLRVGVRTALDLEDEEVALEDHGHDPREDTIVHLHPDHALDQNLRIEVVDVDRLREIGMMMIQVSSHPGQALLQIVIATMDEGAQVSGLPRAHDHLLGDASAQGQIHDHPSK
jgi:hypothetical protein